MHRKFPLTPSYGALVLRESNAKPIGHFLLKGNGPGECINPLYMGHHKDTIFICEGSSTRKMAYTYTLKNDSLQYKCISDVRPQINDNFYTQVSLLKNGLSIGLRLSGQKHLFALLDNKLDTLKTFGNLPIPYDGSTLKYFNGGTTTDGNSFYVAGQNFTYLAGYEIRGQEIITKFERMYVAPSIKNQSERIVFNKESHTTGFYDIKAHKNYLFATYSGKILNKRKTDGAAALLADCIIVFDKQGNPLAKLDPSLKLRDLIPTDDKLYLLDLDCNIEAADMHEIMKFLK